MTTMKLASEWWTWRCLKMRHYDQYIAILNGEPDHKQWNLWAFKYIFSFWMFCDRDSEFWTASFLRSMLLLLMCVYIYMIYSQKPYGFAQEQGTHLSVRWFIISHPKIHLLHFFHRMPIFDPRSKGSFCQGAISRVSLLVRCKSEHFLSCDPGRRAGRNINHYFRFREQGPQNKTKW